MTSQRAVSLARELSEIPDRTLAAALNALGHEGRRRLKLALTEASWRGRDEDRLTAKLKRMDEARAIIDANEYATLSSRTMAYALGSGDVHWRTAEMLAETMPRTYKVYTEPGHTGRRIRNIKKTRTT